MSWRRLYWGWGGRLNRLQCLLGVYSLGFASTAVTMLLLPLVAPPAPGGGYVATNEVWAVMCVTQALVAPFQASVLVRRAHDLGVSGYWLLGLVVLFAAGVLLVDAWPGLRGSVVEVLVVVPFAVSGLALLFIPGQKQANRFGPPPRAGSLP